MSVAQTRRNGGARAAAERRFSTQPFGAAARRRRARGAPMAAANATTTQNRSPAWGRCDSPRMSPERPASTLGAAGNMGDTWATWATAAWSVVCAAPVVSPADPGRNSAASTDSSTSKGAIGERQRKACRSVHRTVTNGNHKRLMFPRRFCAMNPRVANEVATGRPARAENGPGAWLSSSAWVFVGQFRPRRFSAPGPHFARGRRARGGPSGS